MFRKSLTALAAAALVAGAALASTPSFAKGGFGGGHVGHGGGMMKISHGGHGGFIHRPHFRPHWHVQYRHYRYYRPYVYAAVPAVSTVRSFCSCLTKTYTPDGTVIFKDVCTNEVASNAPARPVAELPAPQMAQAQDPNNFAGKTYQDFMAAQPK